MTPHRSILDSFEFNMGPMFYGAMRMPINNFIDLIAPDSCREEMLVLELKDRVLGYLREKKQATVFEIADEFKIGLNEVALILEKLEIERKIKISG